MQLSLAMPTAESVVRPHASQAPMATPDRRRHSRAPLATPALVDAFSEYHHARCENVSQSGIALSCEAPLPLGKTVELYFELPSGVAIETQARVVRLGNSRMALTFVALDAQAEIALRAHCHLAAMR
jgi:hypothetical protein